MSKSRNPNPDHYKVAGGPKPAKAVAKASKRALETKRAELDRWSRRPAKKKTGRAGTKKR